MGNSPDTGTGTEYSKLVLNVVRGEKAFELVFFLVVLAVIIRTTVRHLCPTRESRASVIMFYLVATADSIALIAECSWYTYRPQSYLEQYSFTDSTYVPILSELEAFDTCINYALMVLLTLMMYKLNLTIKLIIDQGSTEKHLAKERCAKVVALTAVLGYTANLVLDAIY